VAAASQRAARALVRGGDQALTHVLTTRDRVGSAAEGKALLASDEHPDVAADQVQKALMTVVPVIRIVGRGSRFVRMPSVLAVSTAMSAAMAVRRGVREVQVIGALVDHRIEEATGRPADPKLASALAVSLYHDPKREPSPVGSRGRLGRVAARLAVRGAFGRDTGDAAARALDAAERVDGASQAARWASRP
jgi:hypothetical protein